jgi:hypothetical protein
MSGSVPQVALPVCFAMTRAGPRPRVKSAILREANLMARSARRALGAGDAANAVAAQVSEIPRQESIPESFSNMGFGRPRRRPANRNSGRQ